MMKFFVLAAAALASVVVAKDKVSVKGYTASIDADDTKCKFGSGDIAAACGTCAKSIAECATAPNKVKTCINDISSFAKDCGGCAVDILECL